MSLNTITANLTLDANAKASKINAANSAAFNSYEGEASTEADAGTCLECKYNGTMTKVTVLL